MVHSLPFLIFLYTTKLSQYSTTPFMLLNLKKNFSLRIIVKIVPCHFITAFILNIKYVSKNRWKTYRKCQEKYKIKEKIKDVPFIIQIKTFYFWKSFLSEVLFNAILKIKNFLKFLILNIKQHFITIFLETYRFMVIF